MMTENTVADVKLNRNLIDSLRDELYGIASACRLHEMALDNDQILEAAADQKVSLAAIFGALRYQVDHIASTLEEMVDDADRAKA